MTTPSTLSQKKSFLPEMSLVSCIHAVSRKATKHCRRCLHALCTSRRKWLLWRHPDMETRVYRVKDRRWSEAEGVSD